MKSSSSLKKIVLLVLLISIFFVLNWTGLSKKIKNFFYLISAPAQRPLWQVGDSVSDFFETIGDIKDLKKQNEELELKNQELLAEVVALREVKEENEVLREALRVGLGERFELILAKVIGKDISEDSILIDKGAKQGIKKDVPVVTSQKVLLGKVGEVYEDFSRVILISNKEISFDAKIQTSWCPRPTCNLSEIKQEKNASGLVKGKGGFKAFVDFIPQEKEVSKGDIVVTSALGGVFPEGLLVGQVNSVRKSDIEPFKQAEIIPAFDIKEIDEIFIIGKIR